MGCAEAVLNIPNQRMVRITFATSGAKLSLTSSALRHRADMFNALTCAHAADYAR